MAFPVTCPSCGKAFQLATDIYERKVAGKVVSIKCKGCQSGIRVDATVPGQVKVLGATPAAAGTDSRRPPATSIHEDSGAMRARQPTLLGMTAPSGPTASGDTAEPLWAVDSGGAGEDRELNDAQIASEIASGTLAPSTLVWREGFGDWVEIANVPQLAQHLPGAKKPAGVPARAAAKSAPVNPSPVRPASSPLNPTPAARPASAPINPTPAAKSAPLNAPAPAQPALPQSAPKSAALPARAPAAAPAPRATAAKVPEPRAPQRSAPQIDAPQPSKIDLGLEDDDDSTMIYRAPTDLVAQLTAEEKAAPPPPAAGRPSMTKPGSAPKAAAQPPAPPPPPPLPAAAPPARAAAPLPPKSAPKAPAPTAPAAPSLRSFVTEPAPPASDPLPAPTISAEPEPPLVSAQPFPVLSAPIATRPLDPSIPIKGLEFPPAPRVPQGAMPAQVAAAPFGAPTPGVTPTSAPPGMGMLAPNPFGALPATDLDFPAKRSKLPYVIAALLGAAAIAGVVAVILTSKAAPPPVPVPVAVPTATSTSPSLTAPTATTNDTGTPSSTAPDPIANPSGAPGATGSGNFSQMFAAGVESAQKSGGPVAANNPPFDAEAARKAVVGQLTKVAACREAGSPVGQTTAAITFDPSGKVSGVTVGAPFAGTATGTCMVTAFKEVQVAPFSGAPATVSQIVSLR